MAGTISLKEIFEVLKKRILLIISLIIGAAVISAIFSYLILTPTYESSSQFIVNQDTDSEVMDYNQLRSNVEIINTYNVIIKSSAILEAVIEEMNLSLSSEQLSEKIAVSSEQNSQVVTVTATDTKPGIAVAIANTTVEVFQDRIPDLMNVNNVNILSTAELSDDPQQVSPKPVLNIAIAIVLGAIVGIGIAFLLEYMDNTLETETDVENKLGLPILGVISHISEEDMASGKSMPAGSARARGGKYNGATKKSI